VGFYINPSRRPPRNPPAGEKGDFRPPGRGEVSGASRGGPQRGPWSPWSRLPAPGNRGAPARGVDVKPPSRGRSAGPGGLPGALPGALEGPDGIPGPCPGGLGPRSPGPRSPEAWGGPGGLPGPPRAPREGGFTSTPRGGAPRFPGVREPETPRSVESLQGRPRP